MLEYYTYQKLLEYDQADRKNPVKIRREQERQMAYTANRDQGTFSQWFGSALGLFHKPERR
ncbi:MULTISPECIES: hypothetical protein [Paenibacillus]|uniref:Uncharacterized protein n=1 Tax=Paenibacillus albilobatus TaxID=2716884 RepID=A0A920CAP9_9BACL|nr:MULTISPECIES: hypothetical protein [Paenibacillus]GIO29652.1 hypothetical protein J2TS6_07930 [Paenibacillus albilobatus]